MNQSVKISAGRFALSAVAAATLTMAAGNACALGLGRMSVQSALGESLRAEIDITSLTPEEANSLRVRVASPDAYRAAGVDYSAVLPGTQVTVARRADGRPYLRVSSDRVVQEPFVDVILEVTWSSGRLTREYTMLLDPPGTRTAAAPAPAPVAPAISAAPAPAPRAAAPAPAPVPVAAPAAPAPAPAPRAAAAPAPTPAARSAAAAPRAAGNVDEYRVRQGDTLSRVAQRTQREGVSLDQMLVALFRANPQAFVEENMNRLKAGTTLAVPKAEQARDIAPAEAKQVIQAQSADFAAYRERLASGVPLVKSREPARAAGGRVQAQVDDKKAPAAATPDRLQLSQGGVRPGAAASDARVSKETEQKAQTARVAELSRNVQELKNLQAGTAGAASAPGAAAPAAAPAAPAPAPAPATVVAAAPPPPPPPAPAPAPAAAPAPIPAPPAPAPAPRPASAPALATKPPALPTADAGPLDGLLESPYLLYGLGGVAALLGLFGVYRWRSRPSAESGETSFLESRLQPDSFFGASGGQRIDTRDASGASSSMSYSLSQLDAIGDVDPVAEADVYLAYGRDLQAEEILKEAMRGSPDRLAIRSKLLEVYAKRRDTKGYELLATQLFGLTGGEGDDWHKAQQLGQQIDPENPLYQPGGRPAAVVQDGRTAVVEALGASTMPQSVMPPHTAGFAPSDVPTGEPGANVDLDLDLVAAPPAPAPVSLESTQPLPSLEGVPAARAADPKAMEFDLGGLSLDLGTPAPADDGFDSTQGGGAGSSGGALDASDPLLRKLELAEEFRQIGDMEGARDLLEEVIAKASGPLKARAQSLLDGLA
ncbi:MAG TPA: FimV/HubP family polar landmark protein [Burkholderiaceae bacterium]|nr:FimV/HubP family polar landmark protein [Burkholderiaceae bacterium]